MSLEQITWEQEEKVQRLRKKYNHETASHAFQSLYLWAPAMGLSIELEEDFFAVKAEKRGVNTWFFPCGSQEAKKAFLERHIGEENFTVCYAREEDAAFAMEHFPGYFDFEERAGDGEYLYWKEEQIGLKGRKFSKLRGHIHKATRAMKLEVRLLTRENIGEAGEIARQWNRLSHEEGEDGLIDLNAADRLLNNWDRLKASGILVTVDGEPYAIAGGYALTEDTFDLCMAKQKGYPPGLSQYVKWQFYLSLPGQYAWVNAEEDLGIEGLRMMKKQMQPAARIRMFDGKVAVT